jgi:Golgi nucleoside diphosphatase
MLYAQKDNASSLPFRMYRAVRMQPTGRLYAGAGAFVVFVILSVYYLSGAPEYNRGGFNLTAINVKVLPGTLSDDQLAKLDKSAFNYLAMIDAGSSGCRAHVYRYGRLDSATGPLYILPHHDSKKVKPGLSSFAKNPGDAGASLQGLVDFIKEQVPPGEWGSTPIWLKATAGLRLLPKQESGAILESVRAFMGDTTKCPFAFQAPHARIISGNEEGGFGWIAFNYLKKIIGPKKAAGTSPYAVVEMGGASSQVRYPTKSRPHAFMPSCPPPLLVSLRV